jgi:hypothetical protein
VLAALLASVGGAAWLFRAEPPMSGWLQSARDLLDRR